MPQFKTKVKHLYGNGLQERSELVQVTDLRVSAVYRVNKEDQKWWRNRAQTSFRKAA